MIKHTFIAAAIVAQLFCIHPALAESTRFDISEFAVEGASLLPAFEIQQTLKPFAGTNREMSDVNKAPDALRKLYADAGYNIVQVVLPEQIIQSGVVVLKVIEDKLVSVSVEGNKLHDEQNIRHSLPILQLGHSINAKELEAAIALANENPSKQVAVALKPAAQVGEVEARVNVNAEDSASKWTLGADNTGSSATGFTKTFLTYQNTNLSNKDDVLTLQGTVFPSKLSTAQSINAGYHIPLYGYGVGLDLLGAYSSTSTQNGSIYFSGQGTVLGAHLSIPFPSTAEVHHKVMLGMDSKATKNSMTACTGTCGSVTENPFDLTYAAQIAGPGLQSQASLSYVLNVPFGANSGAVAYQLARPSFGALQATPHWNAWRFTVSETLSLPADWQARLNFNGQYSRMLLLPSEQFGVGGAASVRGYPERIVAGDRGYAANLEVYLPSLYHFDSDRGSVRPLVFTDFGKTILNDTFLPASSRYTILSSVGLGVRVAGGDGFSLKLDIGWPNKPFSNGATNIKKNHASSHVSVNMSY